MTLATSHISIAPDAGRDKLRLALTQNFIARGWAHVTKMEGTKWKALGQLSDGPKRLLDQVFAEFDVKTVQAVDADVIKLVRDTLKATRAKIFCENGEPAINDVD